MMTTVETKRRSVIQQEYAKKNRINRSEFERVIRASAVASLTNGEFKLNEFVFFGKRHPSNREKVK